MLNYTNTIVFRLSILVTVLFYSQFYSQIASWNFTGENNLATSAADYHNTALSSQPILTRGAGAVASTGNNSFRTTGFGNNGIAVTNTDYFQFSISLQSGYQLALSSIDYVMDGTATYNANSGVTTQFAYSLDDINYTLLDNPITNVTKNRTLSLASVAALQNLEGGSTVYFRFYASGQTSTGGWGFNSPNSTTNGLVVNGTIESSTIPKSTISTSSSLTESNLNGAILNLKLQNEQFNTTNLLPSNFSLVGAPTGVTVGSVSRLSDTEVNLQLAYTDQDFDVNSNFKVRINSGVLTNSTTNLDSNELLVTANIESLSATALSAFGAYCLNSSGGIVQSFILSGVNLRSGIIDLGARNGYSYSESNTGPFTPTLQFANNSQTLNGGKEIFVKFEPTTSGNFNGNIAISGGTAAAINVTVNGSGISAALPTVSTNSVITNAATTATLRALSVSNGSCPSAIERGFVYSVNAENTNPLIGGAGVIKSVATFGTGTTYTLAITNLLEGTTYAYRAYLFDGANYYYGDVVTFQTTITQPANIASSRVCMQNTSATLNWTYNTGTNPGHGVLVFAVEGSTISTSPLSTLITDYTNSNSNFSALTNATPLGVLVYKGSGTTVDVAGLQEGHTYSFRIVSYKESAELRSAATGSTAVSLIQDVVADDNVKTFTATPSNTQVTLNWTNGNPTACFDEVLIVANQGQVTFVPTGDGSSYVANAVWQGAGNQVVYKGTATSRTITSLTNLTTYCFKIFVRRGTHWSEGKEVCVTPDVSYCASTGASTNASGIQLVEFSTLSNSSSSSNGYGDYTSQIAQVDIGESYPLRVNVNTSGNFTSYVKAWVDWNRNGVFDTSEGYELGTVVNSTSGEPNLSPLILMVPTNAVIGDVRMRVSVQSVANNAAVSYMTSCQSVTFGEVEDYTVRISRPSSAEINVKGGTISIANGFDAPYGLNNTLFAVTTVGNQTAAKDFTIENLGSQPLQLTGTPVVTFEGAHPNDFVVSTQPNSIINSAGSSLLQIRFKPTAAGVRTAWVRIDNNDADENPYLFLVQGTGQCTGTFTGTFLPNNGPVNTIVTITSATNLTGATVVFGGQNLPLLSSSSSEIKVRIPEDAISGNLIVYLSNGCTITQNFTVIKTEFTSCDSASNTTTPSELFISEVTDSTVGGLSYIEIYNGTGTSVNLGTYKLQFYNNGSSIADAIPINLNNVTLANGGVYVVAVGMDTYCPNNGSLANQVSSRSGINFALDKNDHIRLYNGSNWIDSFGLYEDENWSGNSVGEKGASFRRKVAGTVLPATGFSIADWEFVDFIDTDGCAANDYSDVGVFVMAQPTSPKILNQPQYVPYCGAISLLVEGEEGVVGGQNLAYQWFVLPLGENVWQQLSDGGVYLGSTTPNLTILSTATLDGAQYYCQVRENSNTCFKPSDAVQIRDEVTRWSATGWSKGAPEDYSKVIIATNYSTLANGAFDACSLTLEAGKLVINKDHPVSVVNEVINLVDPLDFVIENDASLLQSNDVENSGAVAVRRNVNLTNDRKEYNYLSSPVASQHMKRLFGGLEGNTPFVLSLNEKTGFFVNAKVEEYQIKGRGFAVKETSKNYNPNNTGLAANEARYIGVLNNGSIDYPLNFSTEQVLPQDRGYNVVGNPYSSPLRLKDLYDESVKDGDVIESTFDFWDNYVNGTYIQQGVNYENYAYARYNAFSDVGHSADGQDPQNTNLAFKEPDGILGVGQGMMIKSKGLNAVLKFRNNQRTHQLPGYNFFGKNTQHRNRFWIQLHTPTNMVLANAIAYNDYGTSSFDKGDSKLKLQKSESLYTLADDEKVTINGRGVFSTADTIPLGVLTLDEGWHTLVMNKTEGLFAENQNVYLKDKKLGILTNLTLGSYRFFKENGEVGERFEIVFKESTLDVIQSDANNEIKIFTSKENLHIKSTAQNIAEIEIYAMDGRLIYRGRQDKKEIVLPLSNFVQGIYLLHLELANGSKIVKKIRH